MNKKLLIISILTVFILVAISFSSAVSSNTVKPVEKKESPLFGIRTRRAIEDRLKDLREGIKARFIGERIFWIPLIMSRITSRQMRSVAYTILSCPFFCCK